MVRYLMAKGTADDVIWQMINKKQNVLNDAGIGNEDFGNASCTEITSTRKISEFFPKEPTAGPSSTQVDVKKLLDEDDDIFDGIDC